MNSMKKKLKLLPLSLKLSRWLDSNHFIAIIIFLLFLITSLSHNSFSKSVTNDGNHKLNSEHQIHPHLKISLKEVAKVDAPLFSGKLLQASDVASLSFPNQSLVGISYNYQGEETLGGIDIIRLNQNTITKIASLYTNVAEFSSIKFLDSRHVVVAGANIYAGAYLAIYRINHLTLTKVGELALPSYYATSISLSAFKNRLYVTTGDVNGGLFKINISNFSNPQIENSFGIYHSLFNLPFHGMKAVLSSANGNSSLITIVNNQMEQKHQFEFCQAGIDSPGRLSKMNGDLFTNSCPGTLKWINFKRFGNNKGLSEIASVEVEGKGNGIASVNVMRNHLGLHFLAQGQSGVYVYASSFYHKKLFKVASINFGDQTSSNNIFVRNLFSRKPYLFVANGTAGLRLLEMGLSRSKLAPNDLQAELTID